MKPTLVCHTDLVMKPAAIAGKKYKVVSENDYAIVIRNEQYDLHHFDKDPNSDSYFGRWFEKEEQA